MRRSLLALFPLLSLLVLPSCQTPLKPSGFLGKVDPKMAKNKELPFTRSWKNPKADLSTYTRIAVQPTRTDRLRPLTGLSAVNSRQVLTTNQADAKKLATFSTDEFQRELATSPNRRVQVTQNSPRSADTMILQTNLVELCPGRPMVQLARFFVPFVGILNRPRIGLEGRFIDARTRETLFAFSDLERAELSVLDLQKFGYYGVQRRELSLWAEQLRKVVEGNGNSLIRDSFFCQPLNW